MTRKVTLFLILTFLLTWTIEFAAIGGVTYVFLSGGSNLTSGFIGITGVVLAIITCGFLWLHQNRYRESFTHAWDEFRGGHLSETT